MSKKFMVSSIILLVVAVGLLLTGCGDDMSCRPDGKLLKQGGWYAGFKCGGRF